MDNARTRWFQELHENFNTVTNPTGSEYLQGLKYGIFIGCLRYGYNKDYINATQWMAIAAAAQTITRKEGK